MTVPAGFDALRYLASNPDLAAAFGTDQDAAYAHYQQNGVREGRSTTSFDPLRYLASNLDVANAFGTDRNAAATHYILNGRREGRSTTSFDPLLYAAGYSDLASAFGTDQTAATLHYLQSGRREGRTASAFNALAYIASNTDLIAAFGTSIDAAAQHYLQYGRLENRPLAGFDAVAYLTLNADVEAAFSGNATMAYQHYIQYGVSENRPTSSQDFAGNSLAAARNIGTVDNATLDLTDVVGRSDGDDYYRFALSAAGNIRLSLRNLNANADLQLLSSAGTVLQASTGANNANETINAFGLAAGTYYIRVFSQDGSNTGYRLGLVSTLVAAGSADTAGNTTAAARDLGALGSTAQDISEHVGTDDTNDYYRFTTSATSNFRLTLSGLTADANVALLDANGNSFATSTYSGTTNEAIYYNGLAAGTYYVRVYPNSGSTDYTLNLAAPAAAAGASADRGGNSLATATDSGALGSQAVTINDFVGAADRNDYYRVTIGSRSNLQLSLTGMSADADISLLSSAGSILASSANASNRDESVRYNNLAAGTYYVRVYQYSGDTSYALTMRAPPVSSSNEAPVLSGSIPTLTAVEGSAFSYQVSSSLFVDPEGQALTYTATQTSGAALPSWLSFDAATRSFSGTAPADGADVAVRLTARDPASAATSADFTITTPSASAAASWTVMVYVDGDNNLESYALDDINEMEALNLPSNVNVVVQLDRIGGYATSDGNWTDTRRGRITQDSNTGRIGSTLTSIGEQDMGSGSTLTDFINWGAQNYQATNYALVIWDHGGGLSGTSWDDSSGASNLTVAETSRAIANSNIGRVSLLGFDTCQQGMIEQGVDVRSLCDVMVASQENEPGDGWDYTGWLSTLASNPAASATTLATGAVTAYGNFYRDGESTLAATSTAGYAQLSSSLETFVNTVLNGATRSDWTAINSARSQAHIFGDNDSYRDLGGLMSAIAGSSASQGIRSAASSVRSALSSAVLQQVSISGASGFSIYMPSAYSTIRSDYTETNFAFLSQVNWDGFLSAYQTNARSFGLLASA